MAVGDNNGTPFNPDAFNDRMDRVLMAYGMVTPIGRPVYQFALEHLPALDEPRQAQGPGPDVGQTPPRKKARLNRATGETPLLKKGASDQWLWQDPH